MFENIEANRANFCVGPQAGTFCTVDDEVDPVVMHVKNDSGVLIRSYTFFPQDILHVGPEEEDDYEIIGDEGTYTFHKFISIQYVGPYDLNAYFSGATFYTLEKRAYGKRKFYTYDDPEDPEKTNERIEYRGNIIRRWKLDNVNFRLVLDKTYEFESDSINWYGGNAFAVEHVLTEFDWHTPAGTGVIEVTTTSGLKKYDTLFLGPSSDADNPGEVEEVYVHSVNGTIVEIKTYGGEDPTKWEYVQGDPVTIYRDLFLFADTRPLINQDYIAYAADPTAASLYRLDQTNYGNILNKDQNGFYQGVVCATWNNFYGNLSFVKGSNLVHLATTDYEISRSQDVHLENPNSSTAIPIYDLDIKDTSVYKLQRSILQHDINGTYYEEGWSKYNYHEDTFIPYSNSLTLITDDRLLMRQGQAHVTVVVRDQFGVGLLGKNIWFTMVGDIAGELTPTDGYMTSDANGRATIKYDAGSEYTGMHDITVRVDGGNSAHGSTDLLATTQLQQYHEFISPYLLRTVVLLPFALKIAALPYLSQSMLVPTRPPYVFPGNEATKNDRIGWENNIADPTNILRTASIPTLTSTDNSAVDETSIMIRQSKILLNDSDESQSNTDTTQEAKIHVKELVTTERRVDVNFISRHLTYGHLDNVTLNQFVFVQDARPAMWSLKNNVNTDYWIRLRPFAASLDPATLIIRLREESYLGEGEWQDITDLGVITMFDAGGGLLGIDFFYDPEENFHHNSIIHIDIVVYDTAAIPNIITLDYWFTIIQDYKAPYIVNRYPEIEAFDIPINTDISFDLIDDGEGVDIDTLEIHLNQRIITFTYDEYEPGNYHIYCNVPKEFTFGQTVSLNVRVHDRSDNANRLLDGWRFYCVESTGPWVDMDNTVPDLCLEGRARKQPVAVQVYGINDTGIDYDSIKMEVGGRYRNLKITPIVYRLN